MDIVSGHAMKCNVKDTNYHDEQTNASPFGIEKEEKGEEMKTKGMFQ